MPVFLTGFPGFIAFNILKRLAEQDRTERFVLLVQPLYAERARAAVDGLSAALQEERSRFDILPGDITREGLGLDRLTLELLLAEVTKVFHLAAVYDLAVPEQRAYDVNVNGTRHVNQFVSHLRSLRRYVYFSTAYVSGDRTGRVLESELDRGQGFKNAYERTKFEAEKLVQELMGSAPVTILRPAIVAGDSRTGETMKFDGIYFTMRFLERFRAFPIPFVGRRAVPMNVVPVDFIITATAALANAAAGEGRVCHLVDPEPLSSRELYALICRELLGKEPSWTAPAWLLSVFLSVPWFRRWAGAEREALDYLQYSVEYDTGQTREVLQPLGVRCPGAREYLPRCVAYYRQHRADPEKRVQVR